MRATCAKCGQPWSVSIRKDLNKPFVCPRCTKIKKLTLLVIGFVICCTLVPKLNSIANEQRGYEAIGGEVLIPVLYLVVARLINEIGGFINE